MDAGAVPLLVLCIQEPEIALKRIAASAMSDIAKHSPEVNGMIKEARDGYATLHILSNVHTFAEIF